MPTAKTPKKSAKRTSTAKRATTAKRTPKANRTAPPGKRAANKEATQRRILKAALELFETKGYERTTTSAVAKRAKIAEGTVFNYFETKDDIVLYFMELEIDEAIAAVRKIPASSGATLEEKLFTLIHRQLEYLAPYQSFIGAAFLHSLRPASKLATSARAFSLRQRYMAFVEELLLESIPNGHLNLYSWIVPQLFHLYYVGILLFWLNDTSPGKQTTLAVLDRSIAMGARMLRQGTI